MNRAAATARLSIFSNCLLIAMKLAVGILSGAVSIISEAVHSLMDLAAAVMAFFSIRIAGRPADPEHPYGHEKVENVSGVIEALLIVVAAVLIVTESVKKLLAGEGVQNLELGIAVMIVSGIVNIAVSKRLYKVAREEDSVALEADALHLKTDVYSSLGVACGLLALVILERVFHQAWAVLLDPVVAILIALFILWEAWGMVRKAFAPLIDASLSGEELAALRLIIEAKPGIEAHELRSRRAGGVKHIDFHLAVPAEMNVEAAHGLCDELEREIEVALPNSRVLIHVEPRRP
jgi:cation diffusion facilitator family transporter